MLKKRYRSLEDERIQFLNTRLIEEERFGCSTYIFTDASVFSNIFIKPALIQHSIKKFELQKLDLPSSVALTEEGYFDPFQSAGLVVGGEWYAHVISYDVKNFSLYKAMKQVYIDGGGWEDTPFFQQGVTRIKKGEKYWNGCLTLDRLYARCLKVDKLWSSIANNGVVPADPAITVNIGPNGEIIKNTEGRHRMIIANLLNIDIPVQVVVRHSDWQSVRDLLKNGEYIPEHLHDHMDLQDLN